MWSHVFLLWQTLLDIDNLYVDDNWTWCYNILCPFLLIVYYEKNRLRLQMVR